MPSKPPMGSKGVGRTGPRRNDARAQDARDVLIMLIVALIAGIAVIVGSMAG